MSPEVELADIISEYENLESELRIPIAEKPAYADLVNFHSNAVTPVHRWYYFKEGYSHTLVAKLLDEFKIRKHNVALDPFAGSGTTLLTCQWNGVRPIGIDINPFFTFVQQVKLNWHKYDVTKLDNAVKNLEGLDDVENIQPPELSSFQKLFEEDVLQELCILKAKILSIEDKLIKDLLKLALASIIEEVSLAKKDGKGLKIIREKAEARPLDALMRKIQIIREDLNKLSFFAKEKLEPTLLTRDTRYIDTSEIEPADFVMFSPPYLNTFDYTEVYKLELWFLDFVRNYGEFKALRSTTLRSHNLWKWEWTKIWNNRCLELIVEELVRKQEELWSEIIPRMVRGYFDDMFLSLRNFYDVMKNNTYCIIVVGNSTYGNIPIPTDLLLAQAGKGVGFDPVEIRIARKLGTSSQQLKAMNGNGLRKYLRESIIILHKR